MSATLGIDDMLDGWRSVVDEVGLARDAITLPLEWKEAISEHG